MEYETVVDTRWSWVVAMAAFLAHLITHGIVYSFGILFLTLQENYEGTKAEFSWIPSLTTGWLYLIGPVASIMINRYGCRTVAILGSLLGCLGYFTSIFVRQLYLLYLTLGIVAGCGFGMVFLPAIVIVTKYFNKYRSLACGIALSGAGGGAFIFSPLIDLIIDKYGLKGTLLLLSAIILNCIPCALIFRSLPERKCAKSVHDSPGDDSEIYKNEKTSFLNSENEENCRNIDKQDTIHYDKPETADDINNQKKDRGRDVYCKVPTDPVTIEIIRNDTINGKDDVERINFTGDSLCSLKKDKAKESLPDSILKRYKTLFQCMEVSVFFMTQFLFFAGFYIPFIYIPDKVKGDGIQENNAAWIASTIGISSIAGRVVLGYLADKPFVNRLTMFKVALLMTGVSTSLLPLLKTFWLFVLYAVIYGVSSGITLSLTSVVLADIVGIHLLADAMGLNNLFSAFGSVLGPPVTGLLYDVTKTYTASFLAAGFAMTISGLSLILVSYCRKQGR